MLSVFANRTYRHLLAAQVVALVGTGLATVALGLLAYDLAGGNAGAVLGAALAIRWSPMSASHQWSGHSLTGCRVAPFSSRWT